MRSPCCLYNCEFLHINFSMPEPFFMKLGMHILVPEPIRTAYFINPSHESVFQYVYPLLQLGSSSVKVLP
jgi:hypothetical protein